MINTEKFEYIDIVLSQCEDVLHGRLGEEITKARKLLSELSPCKHDMKRESAHGYPYRPLRCTKCGFEY